MHLHGQHNNIAGIHKGLDAVVDDDANLCEIVHARLADVEHMHVILREGVRLQEARDHR